MAFVQQGFGGPPTTTPAGQARRPDASMSLLSDLVENSLDEGYAQAATRRSPALGSHGSGSRRAVALLLGFGLAGLVLAAAAAHTRASAPSSAVERAALVERIGAQTERADALQRQLERLRAEVDQARSSALDLTAAGSAVRTQLDQLALVSGVVPVRGPGITVVVDDAAPGSRSAGNPSQDSGRVLDRDLQRLLNGLWAAGAEAVSVNGQRLTQLTAIRSAGDAILVAYRPLTPPYEVRAVGDPQQLEIDFVDGPGGRWFRVLQDNYGIRFTVTRAEDLRLPAAAGVSLRLARERGGR
jgi:uncharacterized protein YlxW (UPF0749 family)